MKVLSSLRNITLVALATVALQGQGPQSLPKGFSMVPISPGKVFLVTGGSIPTNSFALIGKTGVVLIDSKTNKQDADGILKSVASVTSLPITHVILTHSDCDHANGIAGIPSSVKVVATKRNLIELEQTLRFGTVESQGIGNAMPDPNRLPTILIDQEKTDTHIDGIHMVLYYTGPAHTSGDLVIYLPDEKVVIAGDYLMQPDPPTADGLPPQQHGMWWKFEKNGSVAGWFKGIDNILSLNADVYMGGHGGKPWTRADVRALRDGLQTDKDKIDAMAEAGKSLPDIQTAFNDQAYPLRSVIPWNSPPRECGRGIGYMPFTFLEYNEWLDKHEEFKGGVING